MVQIGTRLRTCDNSGALNCKCIKVLGNRAPNQKANIGDRIVISVLSARSDKKIKKHDVQIGVLARSTTRTLRPSGLIFYNKSNEVILLDKKGKPVGTRIFGAVTHELRFRRFTKILSMAACIV
jgi:large subunit ribosomal protein L14